MVRLIVVLLMVLSFCNAAEAAVELALEGHQPVIIDEIYHQNNVVYLALEDVLPVLGLTGSWDSVEHVYRIQTPRGTAVISPGSHFLRVGEMYRPLKSFPRFIGGKLRVDEDFVALQLPALLEKSVYLRNLSPAKLDEEPAGSAIDQLFAFLLQKEKPVDAPVLRGIAIDPGHGGQDPGVMATGGMKEKEVVLDVARRLEKQLKMHMGIPVYLTRNDDYTLQGAKRLAAVGQGSVDALVLLHAQGSFNKASRGATLFVRPLEDQPGTAADSNEDSLRLARHLASSLKAVGVKVNGIERASLRPLGRGNLPSVLVELGYLSNTEDLALLGEESYRDKLAQALFRGLKNFSEEPIGG